MLRLYNNIPKWQQLQHLPQIHGISLFSSLSTAVVTAGFLHLKATFARVHSPHFPCSSPYLISHKCLKVLTSSLLGRPCTCWIYFVTHYRVLVLKYWQSLFNIVLQLLQRMWTVHVNAIFQCGSQKIITQTEIWRSRMPQSMSCHLFPKYFSYGSDQDVHCVGHGTAMHKVTIYFFFFC